MNENGVPRSVVRLSLVVLGLAVTTVLTGCGQTGGKAVPAASTSAASTSVPSTPTASPTASPTAPSSPVAPASSQLESEKGFVFITAACGNPAVINTHQSSKILSRAIEWGMCMGRPESTSTYVAVYATPTDLAIDTPHLDGKYRYATHTDETGMAWLFLVESTDPSSLRPLERYGFAVN